MRKIYFLCTGNSCRSQIAEGYGHKFLDSKEFEVKSAGIETHGLNPRAVKVTAGVTHEHWGLEDPAKATGTEEEILTVFRETRELIKEKVKAIR